MNYYVPGTLYIYSIIVRAILQSEHYLFPLFSYFVQGHTANTRQNLIHTPIPKLLQGQTLELDYLGSKLSSTRTSYVTLRQSINLSVPQFPHL